MTDMTDLMSGWDIGHGDAIEWLPWGGEGAPARAKVLAQADGFHVVLVEAPAGYRGTPHEHQHPEMVYVLAGALRTQGREMVAGDAYAAASGSRHTDFATDLGATYVLVFKL